MVTGLSDNLLLGLLVMAASMNGIVLLRIARLLQEIKGNK